MKVLSRRRTEEREPSSVYMGLSGKEVFPRSTRAGVRVLVEYIGSSDYVIVGLIYPSVDRMIDVETESTIVAVASTLDTHFYSRERRIEGSVL